MSEPPGAPPPAEVTPEPETATAGEETQVPVAKATRRELEIPDGLTPSEEDELEDAAEEEANAANEDAGDEGESHDISEALERGIRYTTELTDAELAELWTKDPAQLGSISLGFVDEGRIINGYQFPPGEGYRVVQPHKAWGTQETVEAVITAIREVRRQYPDAPPLRVNQLSSPEGGHLRPHKSHQNGRDVDLAFYYPTAEPIRARARENYIDVAKNWALIKALVSYTDVQMILVDHRVQKVIYNHALKAGEDKAWLDSLFRAGRNSLIRHARRHRDHFHVRFYNGRAQELGRRVAPLLAMRPEQNLRMHKVRRGDTLGAIANRYGTTVSVIKKANRLQSSLLRVSQVLKVPLRGPCTRCPVPPPVHVPPRRVPPGFQDASTVASRNVTPASSGSSEVSQAHAFTAVAADTSGPPITPRKSPAVVLPVTLPSVWSAIPGAVTR